MSLKHKKTKSANMLKIIRYIAFLGIGLMAITLTYKDMSSRDSQNTAVSAPFIGGSFDLTDSKGGRVSNQDFNGKLMLVYFGFASCPDVCPVELAKISTVLTKLDKEALKVATVFITVDPVNDTPAKLADFAKAFDPSIVYLTGTNDEITKARKSYKVFSVQIQKDGMDTIEHSSIIYLMDRQGNYLTHFTIEDSAEKILAAINKNL